MIPPSMESIFLILSGVILAAGILYWFWSHIQLTQKKVQLLENAVFELRGMLTSASSAPEPVAEPVYNDLPDDDWEPREGGVASSPIRGTSLEELASADSSNSSDLQPGGAAMAGSEEESESEVKETQFRELFIQHEPVPSPPKIEKEVVAESLESMPVKELRRLAEQRGLTGVNELKKKELLSALRHQIVSVHSPVTLDLTEKKVETEAEAEAEVEELKDISE